MTTDASRTRRPEKRTAPYWIAMIVILVGLGAWWADEFWFSTGGWTISCGTYLAESAEEIEFFESRFERWREMNGFEPAEDPGGMRSWAGVHSADGTTEWYLGSYEDSPPFRLRVTSSDLAEGRLKQYSFFHSWRVRFYHWDRMRDLADDFTWTMAQWMEETKAEWEKHMAGSEQAAKRVKVAWE